jgi:hypothetical protein
MILGLVARAGIAVLSGGSIRAARIKNAPLPQCVHRAEGAKFAARQAGNKENSQNYPQKRGAFASRRFNLRLCGRGVSLPQIGRVWFCRM